MFDFGWAGFWFFLLFCIGVGYGWIRAWSARAGIILLLVVIVLLVLSLIASASSGNASSSVFFGPFDVLSQVGYFFIGLVGLFIGMWAGESAYREWKEAK